MKLILEKCFQWFKHKYGGYGGPISLNGINHCEFEYEFEI